VANQGKSAETIVIGLISDTHGLLRPEVFKALAGVSHIFHAGDVGPSDILTELATIAPVTAVYGNTDAPGRPELHERIDVMIGGLRIIVTHGHELGSPNPNTLVKAYPLAKVIVYGHTHKQMVVKAAGLVVVNPGAAGAQRFKLQPSVAKLYITNGKADIEIIPLLSQEAADLAAPPGRESQWSM
jgi:putative phosphoesterase